MRYITSLLIVLSLMVPMAGNAQDEAPAQQPLQTSAAIMPAISVNFSMDDHVHEYADDEDCTLCHNSVTSTFMPQKGICLDCHDKEMLDNVNYSGISSHGPLWALNHRQAAKSNALDCMGCHQQSDCMECHKSGLVNDDVATLDGGLSNVHRSEFRVSHPIAARTDPKLCTTCHETSFCTDCHDDFNPADLALLSHRKGWSSIDISGSEHGDFTEDSCQSCHVDSVLPSHQWSSSHAREARKNLATCQACHPEGDICLRCHSAVTGLGINPHPRDWGRIKNNLSKASGGKTCIKCH